MRALLPSASAVLAITALCAFTANSATPHSNTRELADREHCISSLKTTQCRQIKALVKASIRGINVTKDSLYVRIRRSHKNQVVTLQRSKATGRITYKKTTDCGSKKRALVCKRRFSRSDLSPDGRYKYLSSRKRVRCFVLETTAQAPSGDQPAVTAGLTTSTDGSSSTSETTAEPPTETDTTQTEADTSPHQIAAADRLGLNFIGFYDVTGDDYASSWLQPDSIFATFSDLNLDVYRQLTSADLIWRNIEPTNDAWNFSLTDSIVLNSPQTPIVTLFSYQYASGTPPWATASSEFEKNIGDEAREYVETVVDHYGPYVKYWEIGNEMDHWTALEDDEPIEGANRPPSYAEGETFSPYEQGLFFKSVSDIIRSHDPDAVIFIPGMGGLSDQLLNNWLPGFVSGAGGNSFDVVNFHYYSSYTQLSAQIQSLKVKMSELGIADKQLALTETGSSVDPTNTTHTNYPNSETSQASDVFRRVIPAWAAGVQLTTWHTYSGYDGSDSNFRGFGIIDPATGNRRPAYYALRLLASTLQPFSAVEPVSAPPGQLIYKITSATGSISYVAWGVGNWAVPADASEYTSVAPQPDGSYSWTAVTDSTVLTLSSIPVLVR